MHGRKSIVGTALSVQLQGERACYRFVIQLYAADGTSDEYSVFFRERTRVTAADALADNDYVTFTVAPRRLEPETG